MSDPHLCRRVEEASLNAWPAFHQSLFDGWVLRFSHGFTKRANSIVPLYSTQPYPTQPQPTRRAEVERTLVDQDVIDEAVIDQATIEKVRYCENLYARENLKTIFRLTTVIEWAPLDTLLAGRGYQHVDPTRVLGCELATTRVAVAPRFHEISRQAWLDAYAQATDVPAVGQRLHATLLAGIRTPHVFGAIIIDGMPVACGVAVLERELVGLFDVVTHPQARRLGHARALITSLLDWGKRGGASHAYLQVVESNESARALYAQLGFEGLYEYWYRVAPQ